MFACTSYAIDMTAPFFSLHMHEHIHTHTYIHMHAPTHTCTPLWRYTPSWLAAGTPQRPRWSE